MTKTQKRRLIIISLVVSSCAVALLLVLYALSQNINLFFTPTDVAMGKVRPAQEFRIGGMVTEGSVQRSPASLAVSFTLTDFKHSVQVQYQGILPDLFREGQGIVARGQLNAQKIFIAHEVLAKHDENYMPPEAALALKRAQENKK